MTSSPVANSRLTGIFSKRPAPGRVKTRLSPPLSAADAARLAEAMLRDVVERCSACAEFATALWFAPAAERLWFEASFPQLELVPQHGEGLAEALAEGFAAGLARPRVTSMVVVGSDQPLLSSARIVEAHAALEGGDDLVLAPDPGGGYALVGLRAPRAELFTQVEMSTEGMCRATVVLARELGLRVRLLPEELDVDVEADLVRLDSELERLERGGNLPPEVPRHTADFLRRHVRRSP